MILPHYHPLDINCNLNLVLRMITQTRSPHSLDAISIDAMAGNDWQTRFSIYHPFLRLAPLTDFDVWYLRQNHILVEV